ncbi:uncharacterized protein N7506_011069 [Penicillium brevicompactum]|uniref:uncharacterized protein n=1 Tax=Penicillium brevicompactum TaxID=5074 RepID=UPI00253FE40A|nr:uncharacterized protein N7506_011069 [Penicillium brevicompactum]KAJ5321939.1 hypothetical protein N7506_011069 [Penicillium brevicompactum]
MSYQYPPQGGPPPQGYEGYPLPSRPITPLNRATRNSNTRRPAAILNKTWVIPHLSRARRPSKIKSPVVVARDVSDRVSPFCAVAFTTFNDIDDTFLIAGVGIS